MAVVTAVETPPGWAALSFDERTRFVRRALEVLLHRQEEFV